MTIRYHDSDGAESPDLYPVNVYMYRRDHLKDPLPPVHDAPVYHYTKPSGAIGMMKSGVLWASRYDCMNDPGENQYGWNVIESRYRERISDFSDRVVSQFDETFAYNMRADWLEPLYVASASRERDSLDQFRLYGPVCIEIPRGIWIHDSDEQIFNPHWHRSSWRPVLYGPEAALPFVDRMLDYCAHIIDEPAPWDFTDEGYVSMVAMRVLAMLIKSPAYASENEVRLVLDFVNYAVRDLHERVIEGEKVTYVRIAPELENPGGTRPPALIKSLGLGPTLSDALSGANLQAHISASLPHNPPVWQSANLYRERGQQPFPAP